MVFSGQENVLSWRDRSPSGLLPTLSGLGIPAHTPIAQSRAVARFLALQYGLAGGSLLEGAQADQLAETCCDLEGARAEILAYEPGQPKDSKAKSPWAFASRLDRLLAVAPDPGDPTVAINFGQLQLFEFLMKLEERKPGCVSNLSENLETFRIAVASRPRIAAYLKSPQRLPLTMRESGIDVANEDRRKMYMYASGPKQRKELMATV
eukprot:SAG31_NODE_7091_length_1791_cov_1.579787_2_plen_208_part_00